LAQSGGGRRASLLQQGSIASPSCQNKVIAAGGWRDGVVSQIFGDLLRHLCGAGLFEVHIVQRFITFTGVIELAGVGALCNGAGTLADQSSFEKVLKLVQVNA
jgi:hypothetical protein